VPFIPYYRAHQFNTKLAILLALGIMAGGYFGGILAQTISVVHLKRIFGVVLLTVAIRLILKP
jgi:uncharacterized membrane protein YfcA